MYAWSIFNAVIFKPSCSVTPGSSNQLRIASRYHCQVLLVTITVFVSFMFHKTFTIFKIRTALLQHMFFLIKTAVHSSQFVFVAHTPAGASDPTQARKCTACGELVGNTALPPVTGITSVAKPADSSSEPNTPVFVSNIYNTSLTDQ